MEPPLCRPSNVLLILLIFSIVFVRSNAEVVTLTADTFTDKVKEKDTVWFVKFCVPWCKYCKKLGTLWEDLGKTVEAEDEIEVGEVDCSLNKAVCTKVNIHSYPTFKMFYDGEEFAKYQVVSHGARYYLTCFQKSILPCSGGDMSSAFKLWVMILC